MTDRPPCSQYLPMPTITRDQLPVVAVRPTFHDGHWSLLAWNAALPPSWLLLLAVMRPDLIAGTPAAMLWLPMCSIPITFLAQVVGFAASNATGLKGWPLAGLTFLAWAVPFALFTVPAMYGLLFGPIVAAFVFH